MKNNGQKSRRWLATALALALAAMMLTGCSTGAEAETTAPGSAIAQTQVGSVRSATGGSGATAASNGTTVTGSASAAGSAVIGIAIEYERDDLTATWDSASAKTIQFSGSGATTSAAGVSVAGSVVTIKSAGTYVLSGTLANGQIVVDSADKDAVRLVLNGVNLTSASAAPIDVKDAGKLILTLAAGTGNQINDNRTAIAKAGDSEDAFNAAVYAKSDLTVNGDGALTVTSAAGHGLLSKDKLRIISGTLTVNAAKDGIRGRDYVAVRNGAITIRAGSDGIQSNNDEDAAKGFVLIEAGTIGITAGNDGIQAETQVQVKDGTLTLQTGGGSQNATQKTGDMGGQPGFGGFGGFGGSGRLPGQAGTATSTATGATTGTATSTATGATTGGAAMGTAAGTTASDSRKGIKAGQTITINGGTITIDSADDSLHSNGTLTIGNGMISLTSGDDGMHADKILTVSNGSVEIVKSYEGIESSQVVLNGGTVRLKASDDGINVSGGADGSSINGRPGQNTMSGGTGTLSIGNGTIIVNADGDGVDVNGNVAMSGGTLIVQGPTASNNGALDFNSFNLTGGSIIATGSAGMAQAPGSPSTVNSILVNLTAALPAGTLIHIQSASGEHIATFKSDKSVQSIAFSSSALKTGSTYTVWTGGQSTGTFKDGVYEGGAYSGGTQAASLTISGVLTRFGAGGMGGAGGPGGFGGQGGVRPGR